MSVMDSVYQTPRRDPMNNIGAFAPNNYLGNDDYTWNDYENHWFDTYVNQSQFGDNIISNWWNSDQTANKDFARQMVAQQYQNYWESAPEQVKRLKEAGINLNFAAGSVAGSAAGASPMSAPQADAPNPISPIADVANALTGGIGNIANAGKAVAETSEIKKLLPIKAYALTNEANLSLENIGLTRANAKAVNIMNHYRPEQLQLDVARAKLMLPFMMTQMKLFDKQADAEVASAELDRQKIEESKSSISLMDYQAGLYAAQTRSFNAMANRTNQIFEMVNRLGFDPYAGSIVAQLLVDPNVSEDDMQNSLDNMLTYEFELARMRYLGQNNLYHDEDRNAFTLEGDKELEVGRGLIKAREEAEKNINKENRKGMFWNETANKWIRVPSSASVGPFSMSTQ